MTVKSYCTLAAAVFSGHSVPLWAQVYCGVLRSNLRNRANVSARE